VPYTGRFWLHKATN